MEICGQRCQDNCLWAWCCQGVGEEAVNSIVAARKDGAFKDLYDFCNRVDIKKWVNAH